MVIGTYCTRQSSLPINHLLSCKDEKKRLNPFSYAHSLHEEEEEGGEENEREPGRLDLVESLEYKQDRSLCAAR